MYFLCVVIVCLICTSVNLVYEETVNFYIARLYSKCNLPAAYYVQKHADLFCLTRGISQRKYQEFQFHGAANHTPPLLQLLNWDYLLSGPCSVHTTVARWPDFKPHNIKQFLKKRRHVHLAT
jgi:hypothetical protein